MKAVSGLRAYANPKFLPLWLALALALGVALLYLPSVGFSFLHMDDPQYVEKNEVVQKGLTVGGIKSVITKPFESYWIPVTWLSLMADSEFFGTGPAGFHRTNLILHTLNTLLLFLFLWRATGSPWKSFFAAGLWAVHPMRVESVAWVTARKDLLSGFFFLAGLIAWVEYANSRRAGYYFGSLFSMFLGLASKPVLVVFPLVLLTVDLWPLKRFSGRKEELAGAVVEKLPFFALSAVFAGMTLSFQKISLVSQEQVSLLQRLSDVATSYFYYLNEAVWPTRRLILDRTSSLHLNEFGALLAWVFILAITFEAWKKRGRYPAVNASWLWYLATLFPMSGIVAVGLNSVADRFSYLPHMGLSILAVWGLDAILGKREDLRKVGVLFFAVSLVLLTALSNSYLMKWKDSVTLFSFQVEAGGSAFAEASLAEAYAAEGRYEEALPHFQRSLEMVPDEPVTMNSLATMQITMGRFREAVETLEKSFAAVPDNYETHFLAGLAFYGLKDEDRALAHYLRAAEINPSHWPSLYNAGLIYSARGDHDETIGVFKKVAELRPLNAEAHKEIGIALAKTGREEESARYFERALAIEPKNPDYNYNLALALSKSGQKERSAEYFEKALKLDPSHAGAHFNYGILLESGGNREEAKKHFMEVLRQYPDSEEAREALRRTGGAR